MPVGVAVVALVLLTGYQALKAKSALDRVASEFSTLSAQLVAGDTAGATRTLSSAQRHALLARENTRGPGWWLTSRIPGVGPSVTAVRTVADVTNELAADVMPAWVRADAALRPGELRLHHGRLALGPVRRAAPAVEEAQKGLRVQTDRVMALRPGELAPEIAKPVRLMQRKLSRACALSDAASRLVRLLPPMLGADGRRTYLLLFQNNAELRATGGIPGAFATLVADHGRVTLGLQGDASATAPFRRPPVALTPAEKRLFGAKMGRYFQDVNFTPDFPRSARLARAMWVARHGGAVDGVISVDPVALSYVLEGTGPVPLAGGRHLTAQNAVPLLLNGAYFALPGPERQNHFFAAVARRVFTAFSAGDHDSRMLRGLARAAHEQRLLVWSAHPQEQALIAPTRLSGRLDVRPAKAPEVGVFLNDAGGSKMDYYVGYQVSVASDRCQARRQHLTATLRIGSEVPRNTTGMPDYVFESAVGLPRDVVRTTISFYAPVGGYVTRVGLDGRAVDFDSMTLGGRRLVTETVALQPGQTRQLAVTMVSGPGQTARPTLRVTPGARGSGVGAVSASACS